VLAISVLGPVELSRDGQSRVLPAGKTTEVLIRLALDATVTVSVDRLIADLWGVQATGTERNTVQTKISKLRRVLGDPAVVSGGRCGYTLEVDPSVVDAVEVLGLASAARDLIDDGDAATALQTSERALAMFRGDVILCDAGEGEWVIPYRVRLEEVRLGLVEDQLAARMKLGAGRELIGELERLVLRHRQRR
jgi:DNA-binding SARP family transcriptional activator